MASASCSLRRRVSCTKNATISTLFWFISSLSSIATVSSTMSYANVTLTNGNDLSVVVFLPTGIKPSEKTFYYASRFDHGSMIGVISRKAVSSKGNTVTHKLYEADMWRVPHNSNWPESGVGLASEFGVGDDGNFCYYRCGWSGANDVTNGVLGYMEARNGEPFLKIGVGKLLKGTCPTCDSADDFKFNSPYLFAEPPVWMISQMTDNSITLEHEAKLHVWGYRLVKDISLDGSLLSVTSTLTNLGQSPFTTAWYSHNFFTCDQMAVGPGYSIDLDIHNDGSSRSGVYDEPGTWSWSQPLADYAKVRSYSDKVHIEMTQALSPGTRIKTEFVNDGQTTGGFTIRACDTELKGSLEHPEQSMYAYNLYVERATLSPEPQILLHLEPGQTTSWTQRLDIRGLEEPPSSEAMETDALSLWTLSNWNLPNRPVPSLPLMVLFVACCYMWWKRPDSARYGQSYMPVPDHALPQR